MPAAAGNETQIARDLRRGFNVLVEGERGSGKTSLLRSLMWAHHQAAEPREESTQVYVRAAGLNGAAAVLNRILDVIEVVKPRPTNFRSPRRPYGNLRIVVPGGRCACCWTMSTRTLGASSSGCCATSCGRSECSG